MVEHRIVVQNDQPEPFRHLGPVAIIHGLLAQFVVEQQQNERQQRQHGQQRGGADRDCLDRLFADRTDKAHHHIQVIDDADSRAQ
ncbi:MAG: hypothetical protein COT06_08145 [Syntrophobacteraceae bacterium CG07_land_8_20_14_0_80_61_8]|nr:MAG: hypothetical protein COT06_08145 [Syntrophobacteraceae bacterium CG07_land_8_20_14_0_80_61_8]